MPERTHLSIGEVLSLLREEFPDVTISKIRFLESQGLVDPERTPSGYRKFYDHDVDRLRQILRLQREQFLPLKVIRGRLAGEPAGEAGEQAAVESTVSSSRPESLGSETTAHTAEHPAMTPPLPNGPSAVPSGVPGTPSPAATASSREDRSAEGGRLFPDLAPAGDDPEPSPSPPAAEAPPQPAVGQGSAEAAHATASPGGAAERSGRGGPSSRPDGSAPRAGQGRARRPPPPDDDSLTQAELADASGLSEEAIDELVQYGLLLATTSGGFSYFPREEVEVATAAARLAAHGLEARHLRIWRTSTDRVSSLFEQVVTPLVRQRNPQARDEANATLDELADQSRTLHDALLRRALTDLR